MLATPWGRMQAKAPDSTTCTKRALKSVVEERGLLLTEREKGAVISPVVLVLQLAVSIV